MILYILVSVMMFFFLMKMEGFFIAWTDIKIFS